MSIRTTRDLGAAIKQARKMRGFSQGALAKEVGVHQPKISDIERGAPGVRVGLVLQIMRALDMNMSIASSATPATAPPKNKRSSRGRRPDQVDLDKIANTGL